MKLFKSILIALILAALTSCTAPETISCPAAPESDTEDTAGTTDLESETDPPQTAGNSADETAVPGTEPEEITIVLGDDKAEETLLIPGKYADVYAALKKGGWSIFEDMIPVAEAEAVVEEAVMDVPESDFSAGSTAEEPGAVYTEEEVYSKTNTQLAEIDEGDIVKTDGEYIYVLKDSRELLILSADGENTKLLSRSEIVSAERRTESVRQGAHTYNSTVYETARELYISGDRLAVIRTVSSTVGTESTHADIYDVSDPGYPVFVTSCGQDGSYRTSRMKEDEIWLITGYSIRSWQLDEPLDYESYIPGLFTKDTQELMDEDCIVYPETIEQAYYTVVSACDLSSASRTEAKAILSTAPDTVYMNGNHIYLAFAEDYHTTSEPYSDSVYTVTDHQTGVCTKIVRLDVSENIPVSAVGSVPGTLLNQFSMDEYNGYFRVVTSVSSRSYSVYKDEIMGFSNTTKSERIRANALYILNDGLSIIGRIENLAPDENVKSVRFTGNTGYFVTFRQVDPLFTVDLTDPANPAVMSELKIPGFSEYLHPWSDGLLLGLGQDADENTGWTTGMKLSMFNTGDPYAVTEQHKLKLEFYTSEALDNHRAILASESRNLIGFPADSGTKSGYAVYGYDPDSGFFERAYIEMEGKWSGRSRGLFVGDALYIVMQDICTVLDLNDFTILTAVKY